MIESSGASTIEIIPLKLLKTAITIMPPKIWAGIHQRGQNILICPAVMAAKSFPIRKKMQAMETKVGIWLYSNISPLFQPFSRAAKMKADKEFENENAKRTIICPALTASPQETESP